MAKLNTKTKKSQPKQYTHGGNVASNVCKAEELLRSVTGYLLWEDQFYEDGTTIADRIADLIPQVRAEKVYEIALKARNEMYLRHAPLFIVREMARHNTHKAYVGQALYDIIQRADELSEFLALYWKDGKEPISSQVKKGLAKAFTKFDEYQLSKYNRDSSIKLRDVLFMCHAKPQHRAQADLWKRLVSNELTVPDTWETNLSSGKDKKETWSRLLRENKLGGLALLRNLRNMEEAGVDENLIISAIESNNFNKVLPFRFVSAATHAKRFEDTLERAMFRSLTQRPKLAGKTVLVIDVSGSMYGSRLSGHSEMNRARLAATLGAFVREVAERPAIYATAGSDGARVHKTEMVPARRGFALVDAIYNVSDKLGGGGIFLKQVCDYVKTKERNADRIIVITDEQDCDSGNENHPSKADAFGTKNYIINIASSEKGIAYNQKWTHINGWSETVLDYIREYEKI